jgi:hypothetical protein
VSAPLLTLLQFCVLAVLYLFFFRVLRAVWTEVHAPAVVEPSTRSGRRGRRDRGGTPAGGPPAHAVPPPPGHAPAPARAPVSVAAAPTHLVIVEPAAQQGRAVPLGAEVLIGRASTCQLPLDDTFVSSVHARVSAGNGHVSIEDLGSTNGTYVNSQRVHGSAPVRGGDLIQVGNTMLELR